jgi:Ferritin-like domain
MKSLAIITFLAGYVAAHPLTRKSSGYNDVAILNYALTLEHLEDTFYRQGLANFTHQNFLDGGFADPFYQNLVEIAKDEAIHVQFLTSALQGDHIPVEEFEPERLIKICLAAGAPATGECTYSFPVKDVKVGSCKTSSSEYRKAYQ